MKTIVRQQGADIPIVADGLTPRQRTSPGLEDRVLFTATVAGTYEQAAAVASKWGSPMSPVDNARSYELRTRLGTADWKNAGVYTKSRGVVLENLTPGSTYDVQARAVGGTTGYSDWSDPVSHMAT